jgi:glucose-6-phosphate isomerase
VNPLPGHHDLLMANLIAQAEALAFGRSTAEVAPEVAAGGSDASLVAHRSFPGNRPSNAITSLSLTPATLGQLIATYEHKVFTQGVIWDVNSFDQWGVELGKALATTVTAELVSDPEPVLAHDSSTNALITNYRRDRA